MAFGCTRKSGEILAGADTVPTRIAKTGLVAQVLRQKLL
jgi:hypothetical protein